MGNSLNYERAAMILVDALYTTEQAAAEKWNVSRRTVERYLARMRTDPELSQIVASKKAERDQAWADQIPAALEACLLFIKQAGAKADPADPEAIHAVAGAFKLVAEIGVLREVVNARFSDVRSPRQLH